MSFLYVLGLGLVVLVSYPIASGTNTAAAVATGVFFIGSLVLYFCPTVVASAREHPRKVPVIILNVLLGWTLVGWVIALVWAYSAPERRDVAADTASSDSLARLRAEAARPGLESNDDLPAHDIRRRNPAPAVAAPSAAALKRCPFCAEDVKVEAIKCKHCGSALTVTPS
jgi:hypothetical protein